MEHPVERHRRRRSGRRSRAAAARFAAPLEVGAEGATVLLLLAAPLMIATVPIWAVWIAFGLAAGALGAVASAARLRGQRLPWPPLAWLFAGALLAEVLALVPLPPGLLKLVSPRAAGLYDLVLSDLGAWPAWRPLSLDPLQTGLEVARHLTAFAVFLTVAALGERRRRRHRLRTALVLTAVAVVVVAFVQRLLGLDRIFGVWPTRPQGWLFAAFVNPNHFGAYLDLLAPVALGLALTTRDRSKAVLWGLAFVLLAGAALLTLSRGAIVALLASLTVFAVLRGRRSPAPEDGPAPPPRRTPLRSVALPLLVGSALSVAAYLALEPITQELSTLTDTDHLEDEARWTLWREAAPMVGDYWLTGIGRGAWETTFPIYRRTPGGRTFYYAENQPLQLVAEVGVPAGAAILLLLLWQWGAWARRRDLSACEAGLLAGLLALGLHEVADFATFFGGVALPAAAVLGLMLRGSRRRLRAGPALAGLVPAVGLGVLLLARGTGATADADVATLQARLAEGAPLEAAVRPVVVRHPADHMPPLVAARHLLETKGSLQRAIRWIGRALYLSPTERRSHLLASEILARAGHNRQARLEARLAAERGTPVADVLALVARRWRGLPELTEAVPDDPKARLAFARWLAGQRRHEDAIQVLAALRAARPDDADVLAALAGSALALGRTDEARAAARTLAEAHPEDVRGWLSESRAAEAGGDVAAAEAALRAGLERSPADPELSLALAQLLVGKRGDPRGALGVLETMRLPASDRSRERLYVLEGRARQGLGQTRRALEAYRTAARLAPDDPWPRAWIGDVYLEARQYERALAAYEEARRTARGPNAALDARLGRARAQVEALEAFRRRSAIYGRGDVPLPVPDGR